MMEDNNDPPLDPKAISVRPKFSQYDLEGMFSYLHKHIIY